MSDYKKYPSIYGALKPIRPDQYLVELIIKRRSDKKGIKLPNRFWSSKDIQYVYWKKIFAAECTHAKKLFSTYDPDCIINAFNSYECKDILSVTNKKFENIIKQNQHKKDIVELTKEHNELSTVSTNIVPKQPSGKKSKLGKLK